MSDVLINSFSVQPSVPPTVSGGTLTSDATYYYRTFTSNGTLSITDASLNVEIVAVGGGGAGGGPGYSQYAGGGGGAGGLYQSSIVSLSPSNYAIVIGAGGAQSTATIEYDGNSSTIDGTVYGGYGGAGRSTANGNNGLGSGGGGGGGSAYAGGSALGGGFAGAGNSGSAGVSTFAAGGGGGSGSAGSTGTTFAGANGGNGNTVWGRNLCGGGGGGGYYTTGGLAEKGGGRGGIGPDDYNPANNLNGENGVANSGGGGGGAMPYADAYGRVGGAGGSGIVVIRYTRTQVGG